MSLASAVAKAAKTYVPVAAAAEAADSFEPVAAVAGCAGCEAGGPCLFPPGKKPGIDIPQVPMVGPSGAYGGRVMPANNSGDYTMPAVPYEDYKADSLYMTLVVGEVVVLGGATGTANCQPTQGDFSGYYVEIIAVDTTNPQSRQRVGVGRFSVGDCPGDCRTIDVFSDVFEADHACCNGRPLRTNFGRINDGTQLSVDITNLNVGGSITAQVIIRGYCHRGSCGC